MLDWVKDHPYASGAIIIGALVAIYFVSGSGGSASPTVATFGSGSDVEAATALQAAQLQATYMTAQSQAAVQANADTLAAQLQGLKIQADVASNANDLAANVALAKINAEQQVTSLGYTLSAQTQQNAVNQQTAQVSLTTSAATEQQRVLADALVRQSQQQASVAIASINANAATNQALIGSQCSGFLDCLF